MCVGVCKLYGEYLSIALPVVFCKTEKDHPLLIVRKEAKKLVTRVTTTLWTETEQGEKKKKELHSKRCYVSR